VFADGDLRDFLRILEAPPGFEPGVEVLQTSALPLGDGASIGECVFGKRLEYSPLGDVKRRRELRQRYRRSNAGCKQLAVCLSSGVRRPGVLARYWATAHAVSVVPAGTSRC
jgi:hypothetical protein